ncbi:MAG: HPF/RaiA family ribosome-associated protein [Candidatus Gracilibacteria bacterium]
MRIHKRVRNLTEPEQEQFETYLAKKLEALMPVIEAHYPDSDAVHFFPEIQKHHKHTAFAFTCILEIPRKRLMTSETKHTITEALDFAIEKLEQRLTKHLKRLREPPRRQRSIRTMKSLAPELSSEMAEEAFVGFI